jgi:hypothetical protein
LTAPQIILLADTAKNGIISRGGKLPWRCGRFGASTRAADRQASAR